MVQPRQSSQKVVNGVANGSAHGSANGQDGADAIDPSQEKVDRSRWRLLNESGRHTWHYLKSDKEVEEWPQTTADKYHLGLPTVGVALVPLKKNVY
jgi:lanosterol synthase